MPITFPGNKTLTLYAVEGGYSTVEPTPPPSGVSGGDAALGYTADDAAHGTDVTFTTNVAGRFVQASDGLNLLALGDRWELDGVASTYMADLADGDAVGTGPLFASVYTGERTCKRTGLRHSRLASAIKAYRVLNGVSDTNKTAAFGPPAGTMGGATPTYTRYLWASWRTKYCGDHRKLRRHSIDAFSGPPNFIGAADGAGLGEQCTITLSDASTETAWFQSIDTTSTPPRIYFYWPSSTDRALLKGGTIAGNTSTATATFDLAGAVYSAGNLKDFRLTTYDEFVAAGATFNSTAGRQVRLVEAGAVSPDSNGFTHSAPDVNDGIYYDASPANHSELTKLTPDPTTGRWYLKQVLVDMEYGPTEGRVVEIVDGEAITTQFSTNYLPANSPVTINQIGIEDDGTVPFSNEIGEIFVAKTPLRFALSASSTAAGIDYAAIEWGILKSVTVAGTETSVVEINRGGLGDGDLYWYVWNDVTNTPVNSNGILLPGVA